MEIVNLFLAVGTEEEEEEEEEERKLHRSSRKTHCRQPGDRCEKP